MILFGDKKLFCIFAVSLVTIRVIFPSGAGLYRHRLFTTFGWFFYWVYRFINPITNFEPIFSLVIDISLFPLKRIISTDFGLSK